VRHGFDARHEAKQHGDTAAFERQQHPRAEAIHASQGRHQIVDAKPEAQCKKRGSRDAGNADCALPAKIQWVMGRVRHRFFPLLFCKVASAPVLKSIQSGFQTGSTVVSTIGNVRISP
jgi:hypothetical protein